MKISIPIEAGRRYRISKVEEKGVTIFQPGIITAVSGLRAGEYANAKKIQENVFKGIKDLYGTQGYIQASVDFIPKFINSGQEEGEVEVTLVECKAARTVTPSMAAPMRRLAEAMKGKRRRLTAIEMFLVHQPPKFLVATQAVAPGVRASAWPDFIAGL